jgi:hypothetical protein
MNEWMTHGRAATKRVYLKSANMFLPAQSFPLNSLFRNLHSTCDGFFGCLEDEVEESSVVVYTLFAPLTPLNVIGQHLVQFYLAGEDLTTPCIYSGESSSC